MSLDFQTGEMILIDKELNWTSFDVVSKLRNSIKKKLNTFNSVEMHQSFCKRIKISVKELKYVK